MTSKHVGETYRFLELGVGPLLNQVIREAQSRGELSVPVCKIHCREPGESHMRGVHGRYSKVRRKLKAAFLDVFRVRGQIGGIAGERAPL